MCSPFQLRDKVMELMDREIKKGPQGYIFLKLNSVTDRKLIDKLAQASQAGVEVVMNVRGICCIRPGIPGLTDHITIFSIVGRIWSTPASTALPGRSRRSVYLLCRLYDPEHRATGGGGLPGAGPPGAPLHLPHLRCAGL